MALAHDFRVGSATHYSPRLLAQQVVVLILHRAVGEMRVGYRIPRFSLQAKTFILRGVAGSGLPIDKIPHITPPAGGLGRRSRCGGWSMSLQTSYRSVAAGDLAFFPTS